MNSKFRILKTLFDRYQYLVIFSVSFLSLIYVNNLKALIIVFFLILTVIYFLTPSTLLEATFFTLLISLPFEKNIRQWALYSPIIPDPLGYYFYFGITIKIVFGLILLLLLLLPKNRYLLKNVPQSYTSTALLVFFSLASLQSLHWSNRLIFPFAGYLHLGLSVLMFYIGQIFWVNKNRSRIIAYFIALTFFCVFTGLIQMRNQHPLGSFLELTPSNMPGGYYTTDGASQYRVAGFFSHPVYFGSFLSILIPIIIGISLHYSYWLLLITPPLLVVTLSTQSRTTWLNIVFIFSLYLIYLINKLKIKITFKRLSVFGVIFLLSTLPFTYTRLKSIPGLFQNSNSGIARLNHLKLTYQIFQSNPLVGWGLNNFSYEVLRQHYWPTFAAPPHGTIFIFLVELGLPTTIVFCLFLSFLLWPKRNFFHQPILKFSLWVGLITFLISAQFHPLFNLDPTFEFFMFIAGIYCATWTKHH